MCNNHHGCDDDVDGFDGASIDPPFMYPQKHSASRLGSPATLGTSDLFRMGMQPKGTKRGTPKGKPGSSRVEPRALGQWWLPRSSMASKRGFANFFLKSPEYGTSFDSKFRAGFECAFCLLCL